MTVPSILNLPQASQLLGMNKRCWADRTAGPSTSLRFGRDDKVVGVPGRDRERSVHGALNLPQASQLLGMTNAGGRTKQQVAICGRFKLLIFEGPDTWRDDIRAYLERYAQLAPAETFVFRPEFP